MKMTNGERIRQMTDEELAVEITELIINALYSHSICHGIVTETRINEINLEWLKQEVNENG